MIEPTRQNIIDTLLNSRNVLITAHKSPDGDSLGSQLGLAGLLDHMNIPYTIANEGDIPEKYLFLPGIDSIRNIEKMPETAGSFDTVVIIECSSLDRIGEVQRLIDNDARVINIDHHQDNQSFGHINWQDNQASAAGEMIYDLMRHGSFPISKAMATNLYTAILTDTGRFHYSSTTPNSLRVSAHLIELGADPVEITEKVYYNLRPQLIHLTGMALANIQYRLEGRLCLLTVDRKMMEAAGAGRGDTEGLVNYAMYSNGVEVGVLFTEVDDRATKVSFRSQNAIDVADMAAHFGGGGHINASGCFLEMPLDQARETIMKFIKDRLNGSV